MKYQNSFDKLFRTAREQLQKSPACHDWDHTLRVYNNAVHIAELENADIAIVSFAAILHDIGRPQELEDEGKTCHADLGAEIARQLLNEAGIEERDFINHVCACVHSHRFRKRRGSTPATLEAKIVYDADKLDAIGAIGIGRSFHFAGRVGARVHNTAEEAINSPSYSKEDSAYREFLVKLRNIHENMLTEEGKRIAESRHNFMIQFFDQINREVTAQDFSASF